MKKYILVVSLGLLLSGAVAAADDTMKSLFLFQQKMAKSGSTTAMMKLGEMYEQGQGTKQDLDKAIEMYRKAKEGGYADADTAIERVKHAREAQAEAAKHSKAREEAEKHRAEAERKAEQAREEALARKQAEEARREAEAREKAEQAARAKAAAEARHKAQQKKAQLAKAKAKAEAVAKTAQQPTEDDSGFKSDPCKGPAARVMSICK